MKCKKCGFEFTEGLFCPECGTKIDMDAVVEKAVEIDSDRKEILNMDNALEEAAEIDCDEEEILDKDKALEEVLFYYEQSHKKGEATREGDHLFYDRAQVLLQKMIKQKSTDYRIWWEACKPIDFWEETFSEEMLNKFKINDVYFTKALGYADIEDKKIIIEEREAYQERKKSVLDEINQEKAKIRRLEEEKKAKEEQLEKERKKKERQQAEEQKAKEIEQEKIRKEQERIQKEKKKMEDEGKVMALISLVFGIISLCTFGGFIFPEIIGIVCAFNGKKQGKMRGQAKAGLICSCISICIIILVMVLAFNA